MVMCLLCSKEFKRLCGHLGPRHSINIFQYKRQFLNAQTNSEEVLDKIGRDMHRSNNPMFGVHRYGKQAPTYGMKFPGKGLGKRQNDECKQKNRIAHLGKKRSEESKRKQSLTMTGKKRPDISLRMIGKKRPELSLKMIGHPCYNIHGRGKSGFRADLHCFFRSSWEANVARIFDYENIKWIYEPRYKRVYLGICSYLPDFYLPDFNLCVEIKGFDRDNKLKLLYEKYPLFPIKIVDKEIYSILKMKYFQKIENWE